MSNYQIFLASSINEFKDHRNEIGDFIRKIQDVLVDYDIKIKLFECEFHDNSIGIGRKQDEYDEEIKKSQVFIMLIGKRLGEYTLEEYRIAMENNIPQIHILYEDIEHDESVLSFKSQISKKAKTSKFKTQEEINYYIANIMKELLEDKVKIQIKDEGFYIKEEYIKY